MRILSTIKKSRVRIIQGITGIVLVLVLVMSWPASVLAMPQLPDRFQGRLTINGIHVPAGVQISATVSGVQQVFTTVTDAAGYYSLLYVQGDDPDTPQKEGGVSSDQIQFLVAGTNTAGSTFNNGASTTVDLNINADAATGVSQGLSSSAPGVVVARPIIVRLTNQADNSTLNIINGITSYTATVSGTPGGIQFMTVYGVSPFNGPSFNAGTGVFSIANAVSPVQPANTSVAEVAPVLTGNATTSVSLTVSFTAIGTASMPGLNLPEEQSNTITALKRGDADNNGVVSIVDSLAIKQYLVGQLALNQIIPINAASPNHDGAGGDKISIVDALAVEQMLVHQLNAYYE